MAEIAERPGHKDIALRKSSVYTPFPIMTPQNTIWDKFTNLYKRGKKKNHIQTHNSGLMITFDSDYNLFRRDQMEKKGWILLQATVTLQ